MRYLTMCVILVCAASAIGQEFGSRKAYESLSRSQDEAIQRHMKPEVIEADAKLRLEAKRSEPYRVWQGPGKPFSARITGISPLYVWLETRDDETRTVDRMVLSAADKAIVNRKAAALLKSDKETAAKWPGKR